MEELYSVKVKTKPDTRNLYPSERRYSASTVSGLAWVHIALAGTSFLLACLALVNPNVRGDALTTHLNLTERTTLETNAILNESSVETTTEWWDDTSTAGNETDFAAPKEDGYSTILVLAPSLLTVFALAAGAASIMASVRW